MQLNYLKIKYTLELKKPMCPDQQKKNLRKQFNKAGHTSIFKNKTPSSYWKTHKFKHAQFINNIRLRANKQSIYLLHNIGRLSSSI